jgi:hypothetical protein
LTRRDFLLASASLGFCRLSPPSVGGFEGAARYEALLARADGEGWVALPLGERIGRVALSFLGTPYVGWTLERSDDVEPCFVTLEGLDCVTFFETSLAVARLLPEQDRSPEALVRAVERTRYRGGRRTDYLSRLHYTTDWMHDNERKGIVRVLSPDLPGAERFVKTL